MIKDEIANTIYYSLMSVECGDCRFDEEIMNEDMCLLCPIKEVRWGISRSYAELLAEKILKDTQFEREGD